MDLATGMQATSAEIATLRNITEAELHRIRKADGQVSVFDVIRAVTGQAPKPCRMIWYRLAEMHPELTTICGPKEFKPRGRGGNPEVKTICHAQDACPQMLRHISQMPLT